MGYDDGSDDMVAQQSTSATEPSSSSVISYVDVLPELVLELIFEHLKNEPETLASCTKVSNLWDEILWTKKPQFLFHLVLPLLGKRLSYQDLMHCRLTSRNWRGAVDGLNRQVPEWDHHICRYNIFETVSPNLSIARATIRALAFSGWSRFHTFDRKNPERFMNYVRYPPTKENPFPTRTVFFETKHATSWNVADEPHPDEMFYRQWYPNLNTSLESCKYFQLILGIYGGNISHLIYSIQRSMFESTNYIDNHLSPKYLVNMLEFLPQLQSLAVIDIVSACTDYWNHPVPILSKLVSLTVRFDVRSLGISHFLLTSYGKQLQSLECADDDLLLLPQEYDGNAFTFPSLKNLKFLPVPSTYPHTAPRFDYFQKLKSSMIAPCLDRLSLELQYFKSDSMTLFNLMTGLSTLSSTVVELYVDVNGGSSRCSWWEKDREKETINFPGWFACLKIFQIKSSISPVSGEFLSVLSRMPVLQTLIVIQKDSGMPNLTEFEQVWMASPSLQRVYLGPPPLRRQRGGMQEGPLTCFSRKKPDFS